MPLAADDPEVIALECKTYDSGCRLIIHQQLIELYRLAWRQAQRSTETYVKDKSTRKAYILDIKLANDLRRVMQAIGIEEP